MCGPDWQARLAGMKRCLILLSALAITFPSSIASSSQVQSESGSAKNDVSLLELYPPTYPPLAQQARITGAVEIKLNIRPDGTIESADVINGHPILREAALQSARQSRFECTKCAQVLTPYVLTYRFEIVPRDPQKTCTEPEPVATPAKVDVLKHEVAVFAWSMFTCDPPIELIRVRSAKCLYLWKCGVRYPM